MKIVHIVLSIILITSIDTFAQNTFPTNGNVGVGTLSPESSLSILGGGTGVSIESGGSPYYGVLAFNREAANGHIYDPTGGAFQINNGGSDKSLHFQVYNGLGRLITNDALVINDNGYIGLGTNAPTQQLDVTGNILLRNMRNVAGAGTSISFSSYGATDLGPRISSYLDFAEGTKSQSRLILSSYGGGAYNNELTLVNGNVGVGTISPQERLSVNGKIRAQEVKVETANWPDYVFSSDYNLPSLENIRSYIHKNGHLAEIPSSKDIASNGLSLGEMNKLLLKKVEELTLYLIEKNEQLKAQAVKMNEINSKFEKLENRLGKLEQ